MPEIISLTAEPRPGIGKGAARATRRAGRIPGIIYGDGKEPTPVSFEPRELTRAINRAGFFATIVDVAVDGAVQRTLAREVQYHPVTDAAMHVDFMRVGAGAEVHVSVPVGFVNHEAAPGLRRGGILNIVRHTVDIICAVDAIPDRIVVPLNGLEIGDSVHIETLALPEGARPAPGGTRDTTVATIAASSAVREEAAAAAAAPPGEEEAATPAAEA
ncbi:MAG TPA: 50S ribosomal protein L25/general stress protein Ctc [Stellaceae bacterium]|nr:50S ribosomal protein L25/general stress protein Ctc [Stellaceae bacterium]